MDAQSARPVAAIDRLPVELLVVITLEACRSSYRCAAVRDRHKFIMGLAKVSRRFREISIELRNKVVLIELPDQLERAEASGQLSDILLEAEHITMKPSLATSSLPPSNAPSSQPDISPFAFLSAAPQLVPPHLALVESRTFSGALLLALNSTRAGLTILIPTALRSLQLVDLHLVPPLPTQLPNLKFLRLLQIHIEKPMLEAWITHASMPALVALHCSDCWQPSGFLDTWYVPDLDEALVGRLDAAELDNGYYPNWQARRMHERVPILEHITFDEGFSAQARHALVDAMSEWPLASQVPDVITWVLRSSHLQSIVLSEAWRSDVVAASTEPLTSVGPIPDDHPDHLRLAARDLFQRRDAGELDVLWYDDEDLGEELICAVWWRYILERKAATAAQASEGASA